MPWLSPSTARRHFLVEIRASLVDRPLGTKMSFCKNVLPSDSDAVSGGIPESTRFLAQRWLGVIACCECANV
jgi:hypothetical protein